MNYFEQYEDYATYFLIGLFALIVLIKLFSKGNKLLKIEISTAEGNTYYVKEKLLRKYGGHEDQLSKQHWGMDRFRIVALHRLLNEDALNESQKTAATEMLITKCKILISGAEKRGNEELLEQIRSILVVYQN